MTNIYTWFRVALFSIILVTCDVIPPSAGFAEDRTGEIPLISPPTPFPGRCPATKSLPVLEEQQKTASWCGVTTAKIAMDYVFYRGTAPEQCELVSPIASGEAPFTPINCCDQIQQYNHRCTTNRWPEEIFNSRGFSYLDPLTEPLHPPLTWNEAIDELCVEDRPYISTIKPNSSDSTHSVIVHGYKVSYKVLGFIPGVAAPFTHAFLWREVQVYDPYDVVSHWDWERFMLDDSSRSYTHDGDTYKIRKIRLQYVPPRYLKP